MPCLILYYPNNLKSTIPNISSGLNIALHMNFSFINKVLWVPPSNILTIVSLDISSKIKIIYFKVLNL